LDGNTLGVDGGKIGVFEKGDEVRFSGLLQRHDGGRLEAKIGFEVLGNFPDEPLEGQLPDQEIGRLLVLPDFTESDGTRAETMGLLDTTSGSGCALPGGLGGELLTRSLSSGRLASGLLGASH